MVVTNKTKQIKTKNNNFTREPNCIYYYLYSTFSTSANKYSSFSILISLSFFWFSVKPTVLFNFNPRSNTGYVN